VAIADHELNANVHLSASSPGGSGKASLEGASEGRVEIDGEFFDVSNLGAGRFLVRMAGSTEQLLVHVDDTRQPKAVSVEGRSIRVNLREARELALERALSNGPNQAKDGAVRTPMPGRIVRILVSPGQSVALGEPVVIVEAMKMENEVRAARAGTVGRIAVSDGMAVESGAILLEIESPSASS
jgi:biotin carboxyl carrier protein